MIMLEICNIMCLNLSDNDHKQTRIANQCHHSQNKDDSFVTALIMLSPLIAAVSLQAPFRKTSSKFGGGATRNQISTRDRFSKPSGGARVQHSRVNDDGSYSFRYETKDGVARQERGQPGGGVTGSWSYVGADGKQYQVLQTIMIT